MATRRVDPQRRERIIAAALDLIAEEGVAGTSQRKVAARADVPLGSMTYHFANGDELLREAFTRYAAAVSERFAATLAAAGTLQEAREAVVDLIQSLASDSQRDLVLTYELYTLAARRPAFREITHAWMRASRTALGRHFDATTTRQLDALIEGMSIHRALDTRPHDRATALDAVTRITAASGPPDRGPEELIPLSP